MPTDFLSLYCCTVPSPAAAAAAAGPAPGEFRSGRALPPPPRTFPSRTPPRLPALLQCSLPLLCCPPPPPFPFHDFAIRALAARPLCAAAAALAPAATRPCRPRSTLPCMPDVSPPLAAAATAPDDCARTVRSERARSTARGLLRLPDFRTYDSNLPCPLCSIRLARTPCCCAHLAPPCYVPRAHNT
mgnify:CR=1 FL=1